VEDLHKLLSQSKHRNRVVVQKHVRLLKQMARHSMARVLPSPEETVVRMCEKGDSDGALMVLRNTRQERKRSTALAFAQNTLNAMGRSQGRRHNDVAHMLYTVLSIWGGPRVTTFLADNSNGPVQSTIDAWKKKAHVPFEPQWIEKNFIRAAAIYKEAMKTLKHGRVPAEMVEDETSHQDQLSWDPRTDVLVGA
jgi:hypothetical protein